MAITHGTPTRTAVADCVVDRVDLGSGPGKLKIRAGTTVLATVILADPAFGAAAAGSATLAGLPLSVAASSTGTPDNFQITDSDDNIIIAGSVTTSGGGGDLIVSAATITSGQTFQVTSGSYSAPA